MDQSIPDENDAGKVKSKQSTRVSYLRFQNRTLRKVDVIWINYEGVRVKYKTLEPNDHFDVTSFVSHPWIFRDAETHMKLICSSREVFDCPEPVYVKVKEGGVKQTRVVVSITLPLYSLRECAMQAIQRQVRDPQHFYSLGIPSILQKELHDMFNPKFHKHKICSRSSLTAPAGPND